MKLDSVSNHLAIWATALGTLIGGYLAVTTYMESAAKQVDERKVQVFNLHHRFTSEPMFSIRKRVYSEITRAAGCNKIDQVAGFSDDNDRFAFVEFFDVIEACITSSLCDPGLAERLFVPYANGHWPYLQGYIEGVRRGEASMKLTVPFGTGLQKLARNPTKLAC